MSEVFTTTVLGVGPWCIDFPDGEIVHCRTEARAKLLAAAPELLKALKDIVAVTADCGGYEACQKDDFSEARAAIAKAIA